MDLHTLTSSNETDVLHTRTTPHWTHHVAAASMVAGAVLLLTGRKRQALAVAAAGAAFTLLERPEDAQELWSKLPGYIRGGQDFLVRAETFVEKLAEQVARVRESVSRQV